MLLWKAEIIPKTVINNSDIKSSRATNQHGPSSATVGTWFFLPYHCLPDVMRGKESVRKGVTGNPSALVRLQMGLSDQA